HPPVFNQASWLASSLSVLRTDDEEPIISRKRGGSTAIYRRQYQLVGIRACTGDFIGYFPVLTVLVLNQFVLTRTGEPATILDVHFACWQNYCYGITWVGLRRTHRCDREIPIVIVSKIEIHIRRGVRF